MNRQQRRASAKRSFSTQFTIEQSDGVKEIVLKSRPYSQNDILCLQYHYMDLHQNLDEFTPQTKRERLVGVVKADVGWKEPIDMSLIEGTITDFKFEEGKDEPRVKALCMSYPHLVFPSFLTLSKDEVERLGVEAALDKDGNWVDPRTGRAHKVQKSIIDSHLWLHLDKTRQLLQKAIEPKDVHIGDYVRIAAAIDHYSYDDRKGVKHWAPLYSALRYETIDGKTQEVQKHLINTGLLMSVVQRTDRIGQQVFECRGGDLRTLNAEMKIYNELFGNNKFLEIVEH